MEKRRTIKKGIKQVLVVCAMVLFGQQGMAYQTDTVTYIDDTRIAVNFESQVADMLKENPSWGITGFQALTAAAQEHAKVDAKLPKANRKALDGEEMYAKNSDGVLMMGRYYDCGRCNRMHGAVMASAVALTADGICATNYHVLFRQDSTSSAAGQTDSAYFVGHKDGSVFPIVEVLSYSKDADLAIFRVDTRGKRLTPIPLGEPLHPGAGVRAITHPSRHTYYYSEGVVARNTVNHKRGPGSRRMDITADYAVGSSGGPIFDERGNLVGLVSTTESLMAPGSKSRPVNHQMTIKSTIPVSSIRMLFK